MGSKLVDRGVGAILAEAVSADPDRILVINPGRHTTRRIVEEVERDDGPEIRILASESVLKDVMGDFLVASAAADLIEADRLRLKSGAEDAENALVLTPHEVIALIKMDGTVAGLSTDDPAFVDRLGENYADHWERASTFHLRTPALGRVRSTLREDFGDGVEAEFSAVLDSLDIARGNGEGLDEVTISLLVAARNEVLLYDISKWGEDVGIASKATFSRTKTDLEDRGIIDTEKVPIDVGRPRLRLKVADESIAGADPEGVAAAAMDALG